MNSTVNVAEVERWASAIGGAALTAFGLKQLKDRSPAGAALAAAGTALIVRGATGHCRVYDAAGITTARGRDDTRVAFAGGGRVNVEEAVTISADADVLYAFWRRFSLLPRFMSHLKSVIEIDGFRSRWVVEAPAGRKVQWDAEIVTEVPDQLIAWRTLSGADVVSAGSVRFAALAACRGTEVRIRTQYDPPAGKVGATIAWLLGHDPAGVIREDLRRFKSLMEAGEVPTIDGQPRGRRSILNYD
ncbi:MAG TPA: SRPBCC family protein [Vicinamibacterales bacterium]|nr:SRPBCC family protein [Vicinamibacterales bacterium]